MAPREYDEWLTNWLKHYLADHKCTLTTVEGLKLMVTRLADAGAASRDSAPVCKHNNLEGLWGFRCVDCGGFVGWQSVTHIEEIIEKTIDHFGAQKGESNG